MDGRTGLRIVPQVSIERRFSTPRTEIARFMGVLLHLRIFLLTSHASSLMTGRGEAGLWMIDARDIQLSVLQRRADLVERSTDEFSVRVLSTTYSGAAVLRLLAAMRCSMPPTLDTGVSTAAAIEASVPHNSTSVFAREIPV